MNPLDEIKVTRAADQLDQEAQARWSRCESAAAVGDRYEAKRQSRIAEELQASADELRTVIA